MYTLCARLSDNCELGAPKKYIVCTFRGGGSLSKDKSCPQYIYRNLLCKRGQDFLDSQCTYSIKNIYWTLLLKWRKNILFCSIKIMFNFSQDLMHILHLTIFAAGFSWIPGGAPRWTSRQNHGDHPAVSSHYLSIFQKSRNLSTLSPLIEMYTSERSSDETTVGAVCISNI